MHHDPVLLAAKLAAAANTLDYGTSLPKQQLLDDITHIGNLEFKINDYSRLIEELAKAKTILYIIDNAGEIVLDKLLIELIKRFYPERNKHFVAVVRGVPVINDATIEDAYMVGLDRIAEVIDNGDTAPGTVLSSVSRQMLEIYHRADLIIAKYQGNFETLHLEKEKIYFLFKVKCPAVAQMLQIPEGSLICTKGNL